MRKAGWDLGGMMKLTPFLSYHGYQLTTVGRPRAAMEYLVAVKGTTESVSPLEINKRPIILLVL